MALRPFWTGYLKLSLVTCPVSMVPATTESGKVRFHTINRETGNRVASRYVDAETGKAVADDDQVKGYPRGDDDYVMLEDEELEAVALESTRTIDIETFVPADDIAWIWHDKPHFLAPDDKVGEEAFCVIRDAMAATNMVGIARLVLYRRERAVMLEPRDKGLILWTLRYGDQVREPKEYFERVGGGKPEKDELGLVKTLIRKRSTQWSPELVADPVQLRLKEIIAAKKKGRTRKPKRTPAEAPATGDNVVSIMDALRKSIEAESGRSARR